MNIPLQEEAKSSDSDAPVINEREEAKIIANDEGMI
jgi:hypothetical protein